MNRMKWDGDGYFIGALSDGRQIQVSIDEMMEAASDIGVDFDILLRKSVADDPVELDEFEQHLLNPDDWTICLGANPGVKIIKQEKD